MVLAKSEGADFLSAQVCHPTQVFPDNQWLILEKSPSGTTGRSYCDVWGRRLNMQVCYSDGKQAAKGSSSYYGITRRNTALVGPKSMGDGWLGGGVDVEKLLLVYN